MRIFIFKSEKSPALRAFAGDSEGSKLPQQHGPWHAIGVIRADKAPPFNVSRDAIEKGIAENGYQLFKLKTDAKADAD